MNYNLEAFGPYALVIVAGLFAHACYALSLSMLTLVSSHAIGNSAKHGRVLSLSFGYILGSITATLGLLGLFTYIFSDFVQPMYQPGSWIIVSALVVTVGWLTLLFYYRRGKGTRLWLPRNTIDTISTRAKRITGIGGAFGLGVVMILLELPFLIAPLAIAGSVLSTLPNLEQFIGIVAYTVAASMPLMVVTVMMGGGYKLSTIQRWRETNKKFLQWTSGISLILLGIYLFAMKIWGQGV